MFTALHGFQVGISDVIQAYLQSAEPLIRETFIENPVPEFQLSPDQCVPLFKPLYGLREVSDLWFKTFDQHHQKDFVMTLLQSNPSLNASIVDEFLQGLSGTYVDDVLRAGDLDLRTLSKATSRKL